MVIDGFANDVFEGIPSKVRIGCYWWDIVVVSDREADVTRSWGTTQPEHFVITIRSSITNPSVLANTFVHEILHAIHYAYGLLTEQNESPDEEAFTTLGANGILAFWQDNPYAVEWLSKLVSKSMETK